MIFWRSGSEGSLIPACSSLSVRTYILKHAAVAISNAIASTEHGCLSLSRLHRCDLSPCPLRTDLHAISLSWLYYCMQLAGPTNTPYQGGWFDVELTFDSDFPRSLPRAKFITPIWHPNISESNGSVCIHLSRDSNANCSLAVVLMALQMLLTKPNADSPRNSTAAAAYRKGNGSSFREKAAEWTKRHAMLS